MPTPAQQKYGTSLTLETAVIAIAKVQAAYNCTDIEAITKMQGAAAESGDEFSLEVLCEIKSALIDPVLFGMAEQR